MDWELASEEHPRRGKIHINVELFPKYVFKKEKAMTKQCGWYAWYAMIYVEKGNVHMPISGQIYKTQSQWASSRERNHNTEGQQWGEDIVYPLPFFFWRLYSTMIQMQRKSMCPSGILELAMDPLAKTSRLVFHLLLTTYSKKLVRHNQHQLHILLYSFQNLHQ